MALMTDKQKVARNLVEVTPADARRNFKVKTRSVEMWTGMMVKTVDSYVDPDTGQKLTEIPEIRLIPIGPTHNFFEKDDRDPDNPEIKTKWEIYAEKGFVFLSEAPSEIQRLAKIVKDYQEVQTQINQGARRRWMPEGQSEERELDFAQGEEKPMYPCPECEKAFDNPQKLKMHMKTHTHTFNEQPA